MTTRGQNLVINFEQIDALLNAQSNAPRAL